MVKELITKIEPVKRPKKATNAEIEERLREVRALVLGSTSYPEILRYAATRWGVSQRQTDYYLARIRDEFKAQATRDTEVNYAAAVHRLEDYIRRAIKDGDRKAELAGMRELHKLQGLHINRVDVTTNGEKIELVIDGDFFKPRAALPPPEEE